MAEMYYDSVFIISVFVWAALFGIVTSVIAKRKGHDPVLWWLFGAALFIIALPLALLLKPNEKELIRRGGVKRCPFCAEMIQPNARVCKYCGAELVKIKPSPVQTVEYYHCPQCKANVRQGDLFCKHCGAKIESIVCPTCQKTAQLGDHFCRTCGAPLTVRSELDA